MTELVAALLGAAFGAAFTYYGTWLQQNRDRERARRSLATVLLGELQSVDVTLRGLYRQPTAGVLMPGAFDLIASPPAEAMANFAPDTVQHLLSLGAYLRSIVHMRGEVGEGSSRAQVWQAGALSAVMEIAVHRVAALKQSLEREGGTYVPLPDPNLPMLGADDPRPAPLPPSPFGGGASSRRSVVTPPVRREK